NFQFFRNRRCRVLREFARARSSDNLACRARDFICELTGQKNGRLRNPKISRPFFGFVHAAQQRPIFSRREVGVKASAQIRMHDECLMSNDEGMTKSEAWKRVR